MKKALSLLAAISIIFSTVAFTPRFAAAEESTSVSYDAQDLDSMLTAVSSVIETAIGSLTETNAIMQATIGEAFDSYSQNEGAVEEFYNSSIETANTLYDRFLGQR